MSWDEIGVAVAGVALIGAGIVALLRFRALADRLVAPERAEAGADRSASNGRRVHPPRPRPVLAAGVAVLLLGAGAAALLYALD